jgi:hypothetical protein
MGCFLQHTPSIITMRDFNSKPAAAVAAELCLQTPTSTAALRSAEHTCEHSAALLLQHQTTAAAAAAAAAAVNTIYALGMQVNQSMHLLYATASSRAIRLQAAAVRYMLPRGPQLPPVPW